jgi:hypothetical protein
MLFKETVTVPWLFSGNQIGLNILPAKCRALYFKLIGGTYSNHYAFGSSARSRLVGSTLISLLLRLSTKYNILIVRKFGKQEKCRLPGCNGS